MSKKHSKEKSDFWGEAGDVKFPFFNFKEVGDKVRGVYVGKYQSLSKYGYMQENYVLVKKDGAKVVVGGRSPSIKKDPKSLRIMYGMDKILVGSIIGFLFEKTEENDYGDNLTKYINLKYVGEKDMATAKKFLEMYNLEEVAAAQAGSAKPGKSKASADDDEEIPFDEEEEEDEDEDESDDEDSDDDDSEEEDDDEESKDADDDDEESDDEDEEDEDESDDEDSDDDDSEEEDEDEEEEEEEEEKPKKSVKKEVKKKKKSKK